MGQPIELRPGAIQAVESFKDSAQAKTTNIKEMIADIRGTTVVTGSGSVGSQLTEGLEKVKPLQEGAEMVFDNAENEGAQAVQAVGRLLDADTHSAGNFRT